MPVSVEQAKLGRCGMIPCDQLETITIKRISASGWLFDQYCKKHFADALELLRRLWKERPSDLGPAKDGLCCCHKDCGHFSVISIRLRITGQPEGHGSAQFPFCGDHLNLAFEAIAEIHDAIQRGEA